MLSAELQHPRERLALQAEVFLSVHLFVNHSLCFLCAAALRILSFTINRIQEAHVFYFENMKFASFLKSHPIIFCGAE